MRLAPVAPSCHGWGGQIGVFPLCSWPDSCGKLPPERMTMTREKPQAKEKTKEKPRSAGSARPSADAASQFGLAVGHHQAGRLREAEQHYRQALAADPLHADSLHLLGVLAHQVGRSEIAVELIGKALTQNDRVPDYHYNIG